MGTGEQRPDGVPNFRHFAPAFRTHCGAGALSSLRREIARLGAGRVVVMCGRSLATHPDVLPAIEDALGASLVGRFDGVRAHSPVSSVESAAALVRDTAADCVLAVGGGSAVVTARAAVILAAEGRDVRQLCTRRGEDGSLVSPRLMAPKMPIVIVPTTPTTAYAKAGSAVRDPDTGERLAMFDPKTRAAAVFLDPLPASTAPPGLVQSSALNAWAMAVEGLQSSADPMADAGLLHALRLATRSLLAHHADPHNPAPRLELMVAAVLSGQATDHTGGGLAQALSHAIGPRAGVANGVVEALLVPYVLRFNAPVTSSRTQLTGEVAGWGSGGSASWEAIVEAMVAFLAQIGVPSRLRDVGVPHGVLGEVVAHAVDDWALTGVPRPATAGDLLELLEAAW